MFQRFSNNHEVLLVCPILNCFCLIRCQGDSGSGLYIREQSTGLYHVKGIVSSSLSGPKGCNIEVYSIYTNVIEFTSWIKEDDNEKLVFELTAFWILTNFHLPEPTIA